MYNYNNNDYSEVNFNDIATILNNISIIFLNIKINQANQSI